MLAVLLNYRVLLELHVAFSQDLWVLREGKVQMQGLELGLYMRLDASGWSK